MRRKADIDQLGAISDLVRMLRGLVWLFLLCAGCGAVEQPDSVRTVAAYEVPLPTPLDKARFLDLLKKVAETQGYHVDAATPAELKVQSEVSSITFNAAIWRGDDEEMMASAMDFQDHIGRVWVSFPRGEDATRSTRLRESLVPQIKKVWPRTASLPIMPSGAIPLADDLIRTSSGYALKPSAAEKYEDETG